MRVVIAGGVPRGMLVEVASEVFTGDRDVQTHGGVGWVTIEGGITAVEKLQQRIAQPLTVIEVEMPLGGRGAELYASRRVVPGGAEQDLSDEAREILHDWIQESGGGGFDEDVAALDLAYTLAADFDDADGVVGPQDTRWDTWARAIMDKLIQATAIEVRSVHWPIDRIAKRLEAYDDGEALDPELGTELLDILVDAEGIEEVFADSPELLAVANETRPR